MENFDIFDMRNIINTLRRRGWLIGLCLILALVGAYVFMSQMPPVYTATVTLLVGPTKDTKTSEYTAIYAGERLALTYSELLIGRSVLEEVIERLDLDESVASLANRIKVEPVTNTQLILLSVSGEDPDEAALLANTISQVFMEQVQSFNMQRYVEPMKNLETKINSEKAEIDKYQKEIDDLIAKGIETDVELNQLTSLLTEYRNDNRLLRLDLQSLELTISRLNYSINVAENAIVPGDQTNPPYTATVKLFIEGSMLGGSDYLTYSQMLTGLPIIQAALDEIGWAEEPYKVKEKIVAEPVAGTSLIQLSVTDDDSSRAKLLADTMANIFIRQVQGLLTQPYTERMVSIKQQMDELATLVRDAQNDIKRLTIEKVAVESKLEDLESRQAENRNNYRILTQDYNSLVQTAINAADTVMVTEPAQSPDKPEDIMTRNLLIAAIAGLLIGGALAFLWEYLYDKLRTPQDVLNSLDLQTLGMVSRLKKGQPELVIKANPQSYTAETIRMLSNSIQFSRKDSSIRTLLVTSPSGWEGKSFITANLAVAFAKAGLNVILIDADLRRPRQHQIFDLKQGSGLSECLSNGKINGKLKATRINNLKLMTSGRITKQKTDRIVSPQLRLILEELKQQADIILIDCPPVLPVADAILMAPIVDSVLFVIRAGRTKRTNAQHAIESLRRVNASFLGVVLNDVLMSDQETSSYYLEKPMKPKKFLNLFKKKEKIIKPKTEDTSLEQEPPVLDSDINKTENPVDIYESSIQWGTKKEGGPE